MIRLSSSLPIGVVVEQDHDLPLTRLTLTLTRGAAEDPLERVGLAQFTAELARRGAGGLGRSQLDARFDDLGADLGVSVSHDAVTFDVEVMPRHLDKALGLLSDLLLRPDFLEQEAAQLVRETGAQLDELEDDDPSIARRFFLRALFGASPYGQPTLGTHASLARLDADAARTWMARAVCSGNLIAGAAGDVDPAKFAEVVARRFSVLRPGVSPRTELPPAPTLARTNVTLVDKPGRTQSQIFLGQPTPAWSSPDFLPLAIAVNGFGGTFTSRLMNEVRSKRGLSYGASARVGQGRGPRAVVIYVFPALARTAETLELVLALWRDFVRDGLSDDELAFARENLASSFACDLVTPDDRLDLRVASSVCGLPHDYLRTTPARIRAISDAEVRQAVTRWLRPDALCVTVLGPRAPLAKQLDKIGLGDLTTHERFDHF